MSWAFSILRRTVVRKAWKAIIKQIGPISPNGPLTTGDQSLSCRITKLRQESPRTFKRFGASCYSGVPCFLPEPARQLEPAIYSFLGGFACEKGFLPSKIDQPGGQQLPTDQPPALLRPARPQLPVR